MRFLPVLVLTACCAGALSGVAGEAVLRAVSGSAAGTNQLLNPGFESRQGAAFTSWSAAPNGYQALAGEGRNGSAALACTAPDTTGWRGASQTLTLNRTTAAPLRVRGWSRAQAVTGGRDSDYSVYVDLLYQDGTPLWGQTANFATGTHDWEQREVLIMPEKPVKSLTVHALFRQHAGAVWFDDLEVLEIAASGEAVIFQGAPMVFAAPTNPPSGPAGTFRTADGLALTLHGERATSLAVAGRELAPARGGFGGFLARDLAANSDAFSFAQGECAELGLRLQFSVQAHADHLAVEGTLADTRGSDRAVLLVFALPLDATGWTWSDDIRRARQIEGAGEYGNVVAVPSGTTGSLSLYPLATVHDASTGVGLALDMAHAAQYRLVYHAGTRQLCLAYDFGLVPETRPAGSAHFRFVLFRFDSAWGFRAGWAKLRAVFPDYFQVRARRQGLWMPFTDVGTVQGWEDFGFRFHEGDSAVAWDDAHDILSFHYTEPMTWWMSMAPELPRTEAEAVRVRDDYAAGPASDRQRMAAVSRATSMEDSDGHPALLFRNEPWANGAVWSLNPNPRLPAEPNAATVYWNPTIQTQRYGAGVTARLDGEYLDSLEGYVTAELNFRREHFAASTVPLTFSTDSHQPALGKGLAVYEFTRWISEDVHRLGALMFANSVPHRFGFLCPWLDVLGTETDWFPGGVFQPVSGSQLCLWRTLAGAKPYLLLLNTDFTRLNSALVERYFQKALGYGMFPSCFSHNAAENPYWQNPTWYNRDRALFRKYIPLIRDIAEAGWEPVTAATCSNTNLLVERFGPGTNGLTYFTLANETSQAQSGVLQLVPVPAGAVPPARELLSGQDLVRGNGGWTVQVAAAATVLVRVESGPRFLQAAAEPTGDLRLTIDSPPGLEPVLEASTDLRGWLALVTNAPAASPFTLALPMPTDLPGRYFRLRW